MQQETESPTKLTNRERSREWMQILTVLLASLTSLTCGLLFAWSSPSIPDIIEDKENYDITLEEASYFTVLPPCTLLLCSFPFYKLMTVVGRKTMILLIAVPYLTSWILISQATSVWLFYLARICSGMGDCCLFLALPTYIGEVTTPRIRGTWGNAMTFGIYFGQCLINIIGRFFSVKYTAYICTLPPIVFLSTFVFMPESPYYLIMKKRENSAKDALRKLLRKNDVDREFETLKSDVSRQLSESGTWKDLFLIESNRRALYAGAFLRASQQLSGTAVFIVYTKYIFQESGGNISASTSTIIVTMLNALMNIIAGFTVDRFGRKQSYFYSLLLSAIILLIQTVYLFLEEVQQYDLTIVKWIPIVGTVLYIIVQGFGASIIPTLMLGELFSASIKAKALCLMNIVFGLSMASVNKLFQLMATQYGMYAPFLLFSTTSFAAAYLTGYLVPETRGKTLEEIQQTLKRKR